MKKILLLFVLPVLAACTVLGEIAYDEQVSRERQACERNLAATDRSACLDRVSRIEAEAREQRERRERRDRD